MSVIQEGDNRRGIFEWEIGSFLRKKVTRQKSPLFKVGKCTCNIWITNKQCEENSYEYDYHADVVNDERGDGVLSLDTSSGVRRGGFGGHNPPPLAEPLIHLPIVLQYTFPPPKRNFPNNPPHSVSLRTPLDTRTKYKLCLIDCDGTELVTTKGSSLKKNCDIGIVFCTRHWNDDPFLLRFLWYEKKGNSGLKQNTQLTSKVIPDKKPDTLIEILSRDFSRFYENKTDTDCILKVGDAQFPVHRQVLSARSDVFAAMFHHSTSENRTGVVDIPDVDAAVLDDVLYYVYSGKIRGMSSDSAAPMYVVADKYSLIELRDMCLDVLNRSLTVENVCDAAVLAHMHGESELEETVVQFMAARLEDIEDTDKWKELSKSKPSLAIKLLRSTVFACKDKYKK